MIGSLLGWCTYPNHIPISGVGPSPHGQVHDVAWLEVTAQRALAVLDANWPQEGGVQERLPTSLVVCRSTEAPLRK
jgi:hypothetical protein